MPVVALLALAAYRAALEADLLVDNVELPTLFGWADGAHTGRLHHGPLETGERRERTEEGWFELVGGREAPAPGPPSPRWPRHGAHLRRAGVGGDIRRNGAAPLLLGDRARAVRAAGISDLEPEWAGDVAYARAQIDRLEVALREGLWTPTREHRVFAAILHRTLVAEPDFPSLPGAAARTVPGMDAAVEGKVPPALGEFTELNRWRIEEIHEQVHRGFRGGADRDGGSPAGVWCLQKLPESVLRKSNAVHESARAVLGAAIGLTPQRLVLAAAGERNDVGGGYTATGDPARQYPHQDIAVMILGAGPDQARHLHEAGYTHPELHRCITEFVSCGDLHQMKQRVAEGWLIDPAQAKADAEAVLADPAAAGAVDDLARQLYAEGDLDTGQITATITRHELTRSVSQVVRTPGR